MFIFSHGPSVFWASFLNSLKMCCCSLRYSSPLQLHLLQAKHWFRLSTLNSPASMIKANVRNTVCHFSPPPLEATVFCFVLFCPLSLLVLNMAEGLIDLNPTINYPKAAPLAWSYLWVNGSNFSLINHISRNWILIGCSLVLAISLSFLTSLRLPPN